MYYPPSCHLIFMIWFHKYLLNSWDVMDGELRTKTVICKYSFGWQVGKCHWSVNCWIKKYCFDVSLYYHYWSSSLLGHHKKRWSVIQFFLYSLWIILHFSVFNSHWYQWQFCACTIGEKYLRISSTEQKSPGVQQIVIFDYPYDFMKDATKDYC